MDFTPITALLGASFGGVGVKLIDIFLTLHQEHKDENEDTLHILRKENSNLQSQLVECNKSNVSLESRERALQLEASNLPNLRLFESAIYFAPVGICLTSWNTDFMKIHYLWVNPMFTQIFGYTSEELETTNPMIFYGPKSRMNQIEHRQTTIASGKAYHDENVLYRKDGSEVWCNWHEAGLFENGVMHSVVAVIRETKTIY